MTTRGLGQMFQDPTLVLIFPSAVSVRPFVPVPLSSGLWGLGSGPWEQHGSLQPPHQHQQIWLISHEYVFVYVQSGMSNRSRCISANRPRALDRAFSYSRSRTPSSKVRRNRPCSLRHIFSGVVISEVAEETVPIPFQFRSVPLVFHRDPPLHRLQIKV